MSVCFGCSVELPDEPGMQYCAKCVAQQISEQGDEREAFDAYHRWVDKVSMVNEQESKDV